MPLITRFREVAVGPGLPETVPVTEGARLQISKHDSRASVGSTFMSGNRYIVFWSQCELGSLSLVLVTSP